MPIHQDTKAIYLGQVVFARAIIKVIKAIYLGEVVFARAIIKILKLSIWVRLRLLLVYHQDTKAIYLGECLSLLFAVCLRSLAYICELVRVCAYCTICI